MSRLRVVIVNDSPTMRASLRVALEATGDIDVVAELDDGTTAADVVERLRPSVVLMDVVMPRCNGYEATRAIMSRSPTPVVMVTAVENPTDERVVMQALGAGALGITRAPPAPGTPRYRVAVAGLVQLLRTMAGAKLGPVGTSHGQPPTPEPPAVTEDGTRYVSAIGIVASAGGPPALVEILRALAGKHMPPILVVQHLVAGFTAGFASWLGAETGYRVVVPAAGDALRPSTAYIAPEDHHLGCSRASAAVVTQTGPVGNFRPSGDFLLKSLGESLGRRAVGVVLTGMGRDGAVGADALRRAGGEVITQDAETSIIDGMPRAVRECGAATRVLPLTKISGCLLDMVRGTP
jgi:two-component system, chemotaxis family, protein-glutamate methylesterase/glutaminase